LQPGPAALTEGIRQLHRILAHAADHEVNENLLPLEKVDVDLSSKI
jgi:hypothetical protein